MTELNAQVTSDLQSHLSILGQAASANFLDTAPQIAKDGDQENIAKIKRDLDQAGGMIPAENLEDLPRMAQEMLLNAFESGLDQQELAYIYPGDENGPQMMHTHREMIEAHLALYHFMGTVLGRGSIQDLEIGESYLKSVFGETIGVEALQAIGKLVPSAQTPPQFVAQESGYTPA